MAGCNSLGGWEDAGADRQPRTGRADKELTPTSLGIGLARCDRSVTCGELKITIRLPLPYDPRCDLRPTGWDRLMIALLERSYAVRSAGVR